MEKYSGHISSEDDLVKKHIEKIHASEPEPESIASDIKGIKDQLEVNSQQLELSRGQSRIKRWWNKDTESKLVQENNTLEEHLNVSLDAAIDKLKQYAEDTSDGCWGCLRLFQEALQDKNIKSRLPKNANQKLGPQIDYADPYSILIALRHGKESTGREINKDFIKEVLLWNNERFERARKELHENVEQLKQRFLTSVDEAYKANRFPLPKEEIEKRIANLRYQVRDGVEMGPTYGIYSNRKRTISINHFSDLNEAYDSLVHELIHASAGQTILYRPYETGTTGHDIFDYQRSGLGFMRYKSFKYPDGKIEKFPIGNHFKWLDEAVTEDLSLILRNPTVKSYEEFIQYLDQIANKGVPKPLFYQAYFEHYDPQNDYPIPAWKELSKRLFEVLKDEGGLMALNKYAVIYDKSLESGEPKL